MLARTKPNKRKKLENNFLSQKSHSMFELVVAASQKLNRKRRIKTFLVVLAKRNEFKPRFVGSQARYSRVQSLFSSHFW